MGQEHYFEDELQRAHLHTCLPKSDGSAKFVSDIKWEGMLEGIIVRAPMPRCRILGIDFRKALAMDGVYAVVTAKDIPGANRIGKTVLDQPILCEKETYGVYDAIALLAAETKDKARAAAKLIKVEYEPLSAVYDLQEAKAPGAAIARPDMLDDTNLLREYHYSSGNIEHAFEEADFVIQQHFTIPPIEHCYLENDCAIARFDAEGNLEVALGCHTVTYEQEILSAVLDMPLGKIKVMLPFMGGSFGGKDDGLIAAYAALLAKKAKRSVRVYIDRMEEMVFHTKRHGQQVDIRMGFSVSGKVLGAHYCIELDTGSSSHHGENIGKFISVNACGPYRIPNVKVDTSIFYTNGMAMGAMRSWGMTGITFANECMFNIAAEKLGMDGLKIRKLNGIRDGDDTLSGRTVPACARYDECLAAMEKIPSNPVAPSSRFAYGIGYAGASQGCNLHFGHADKSTVCLHVAKGGRIQIMTCANDLGQGLETTLSLIVSRVLKGYPISHIQYCRPDTDFPEGGPSGASRQTTLTGNATFLAATRLLERALEAGACEQKEAIEFWLKHDGVGTKVEATYTPPMTSDPDDTGKGYPVNQYGYDIQRAEVVVDRLTGMVHVKHLTVVCDCGNVINRIGAEGQIQGAATQGVGMALMENFLQNEGKPIQHGFSDYVFPTAPDTPQIHVEFIDKPAEFGYLRLKGMAELAVTAAAPAVIDAIHNAVGVWITELPASPDKVLLALTKKEQQ